jgi:hypothetical protein
MPTVCTSALATQPRTCQARATWRVFIAGHKLDTAEDACTSHAGKIAHGVLAYHRAHGGTATIVQMESLEI